MTTPEQAMQCCASMNCPSMGRHGMGDRGMGHQDMGDQGMDCCKSMPKHDSAFVLPSALHGISQNAVVVALLPVANPLLGNASLALGIAECSHAPPVFSPPTALPLRI
jgi:hypothetical protein